MSIGWFEPWCFGPNRPYLLYLIDGLHFLIDWLAYYPLAVSPVVILGDDRWEVKSLRKFVE